MRSRTSPARSIAMASHGKAPEDPEAELQTLTENLSRLTASEEEKQSPEVLTICYFDCTTWTERPLISSMGAGPAEAGVGIQVQESSAGPTLQVQETIVSSPEPTVVSSSEPTLQVWKSIASCAGPTLQVREPIASNAGPTMQVWSESIASSAGLHSGDGLGLHSGSLGGDF